MVLLRTGLLRKHALVQTVVQAGQFARLFRGYQVDALHAGGQMFGVTQIPSQAKEVAGKPQHESLFFLAGIAAYLFRKLLDGLERQFLRGHLLDDLLDLLELVFRNERLAELLQVHGRAVIRSDGPDFIAGEDVVENFVQLETVEKLGKKARARRRLRFSGGTYIEQPIGVFRLVQILTKSSGMILHEEIKLLPGGVNLRTQLLHLVFLMLETKLQVVQGGFEVGGITGS